MNPVFQANPVADATARPGVEGYRHTPVLAAAVRELPPPHGRLIVDATLGGGGHAELLLAALPQAELFGCDRDAAALAAATERLAPYRGRMLLKQLPFSQVAAHLQAGSVDFLLADLGVSSPQLDDAARGFSFTREGPLDMRMDAGAGGVTAFELVNQASPARLREILWQYGEERSAARIVQAIAAQRRIAPIATTTALAALVAGAVPRRRHGHIHAATRTFQALRMAVNDELGELEALLDVAPELLAPGGRIAVIAFHSLEDRMVKLRFRAWAEPCVCPPHMPACVCGRQPLGRVLTRKPICASPEEQALNPRSRSARLRAFERGPAQP